MALSQITSNDREWQCPFLSSYVRPLLFLLFIHVNCQIVRYEAVRLYKTHLRALTGNFTCYFVDVSHSKLTDMQNLTLITLEGSCANVGNALNAKENKRISRLVEANSN